MGTPDMLHIMIAKLFGGLMGRWNRTVHTIRKKYYWESDLQDLVRFVTVLMNGPLFSREALHEYTRLIKISSCVNQD